MAVISRPWESYADAVAFRETYLRLLPLIQFTYSKVNPVPVKSLARVLGLPAGELRRPYRGLSGRALREGVEIVRRLGLDTPKYLVGLALLLVLNTYVFDFLEYYHEGAWRQLLAGGNPPGKSEPKDTSPDVAP